MQLYTRRPQVISRQGLKICQGLVILDESGCSEDQTVDVRSGVKCLRLCLASSPGFRNGGDAEDHRLCNEIEIRARFQNHQVRGAQQITDEQPAVPEEACSMIRGMHADKLYEWSRMTV
jgi:hypothetical protein